MYRFFVNSHAPHHVFDVLGKVSVRLQKYAAGCVDLRDATSDPFEARYLSSEKPFVIDVPLESCLGLHSAAFSCSMRGNHPFIRTLTACNASSSSYEGSPLEEFYRTWKPKCGADAVGLSAQDAHPELALRSPFAGVMPWDNKTPQEHELFWRGICKNDYQDHGFTLDSNDGWKCWGPMSQQAGNAEYQRLLRIYRSVGRSGYLRHPALDGDIEGHILQHEEDFRVLVGRGQHRIAALAAAGEASAPIRLFPVVVSRGDVDKWPNVVRGYYTRNQALQVFDRMFDARQPFPQTALDSLGGQPPNFEGRQQSSSSHAKT